MVVKHFVKVIFPFQYNQKEEFDLDEIHCSLNGEKTYKVFQKIGFESVELRRGLSDLFTKEEHKSRIMTAYRVDKIVRGYFDLPQKPTGTIEFYSRAKERTIPYCVELSDMSLYLFESGVGFVEVELRSKSNDLTEQISCNYFLSEIGNEKNYFVVSKKVWKEETKTTEIVKKRFTLKQLLNQMLEYIPGVTDLYSGKKWEKVYKKGIVYSYILMDKKPENFEEVLFNIRQNYKESYKAPKKYNCLQDDPAVLQQFENSYWVSSYNGATNISIKTEDVVTNNFFENDFYGKMHNVYWVLFLAVLHQRYLILKLMWEMGELDCLDFEVSTMKEQLMKAISYKNEVACLQFRDFFKFPSDIQHINDYYKLLYRTFSIEELYRILSNDLNSIEEICKVYVLKINKHEELKKQKRKAIVKAVSTIFTAMLGAITVLNDSWLLLEKAYGIQKGSFSIAVILVTIMLAFPSVVGVIEAIGNVKQIEKEIVMSEHEIRKVGKK